MLAKLRTFALSGIEAVPVEVEVDVSPGAMPKTTLVGLPEAAVRESTHRVERAIPGDAVYRRELRVVGTRFATPRHMHDALARLGRLQVPEPVLLPLERFAEGLELFRARAALKVVLTP